MASGGAASPTDPLEKCQYSDEEIRAAVEEADRRGAYIAAHCHPAEAVRRAAVLGVRSIEHATLIDKQTADLVAKQGAFTVPTMAVIAGLVDEGEKLGFPPVSMEKLRSLCDRALAGLDVMKQAGVKMAFGTDLLGALHVRQSTEFALRGQVLSSIDILRSACSISAELIGQTGQLGCIRPHAFADLLVVEGNPLEDISILAKGGDNLAVIMTNGRFRAI
jgi:imidazolonepropionase-like amidohydrolase